MSPHVQRIFGIVHRITRNREDAEDAMQDAFLRALVRHDDFEGRSTFATWLTRIAINSALMILRKRKNVGTVSLDGGGDSEESESKHFHEVRDHAPDAEQRYLQKEQETTLRDAINALRPSFREIVETVHLGERSIRETADILGVSVAAAKTRLFHARAALRKSTELWRLRNGRQRATNRPSGFTPRTDVFGNETYLRKERT